MAEAKAIARNLRISPRKARLVADLIRGKKVHEARDILAFTVKKASPVVGKLLESAVANAEFAAREAGQRVDTLSFGHRRMVEIARALAGAPRLVLLDEPAAGLGDDDLARLAAVIREGRDQGISWLVVDHNFGFLGAIADRVICMDAGKPIADGSPDAVLAHPDVRRAYFGLAAAGAPS